MSDNKLFGTDGIRGSVHSIPLAPSNVLRLGQILASLALKSSPQKPKIIIGQDTRASGLYLTQALAAGILSAGADCEILGVIPTPAAAFYTQKREAFFGVMVSASHNPPTDNGIKIFDSTGFKIGVDVEHEIEKLYFLGMDYLGHINSHPGNLFRVDGDLAYSHYLQTVVTPQKSLQNMKIVVDCANGSASASAPELFRHFGADAIVINANPDGMNINAGCGSQHPERLMEVVKSAGASLGIAFDGDADRVIFVDELGQLVPGDAILAALAVDLHKRSKLQRASLVATIMSGFALDLSLKGAGIQVLRTEVGDRNVANLMREGGYNFGGENSGHVISFPHATTGDGQLTSLMVLDRLVANAVTMSEWCGIYQVVPNVLLNIDVRTKVPWTNLPKTSALLREQQERLKNEGRIIFRYSGTEMLARLFVEAPSQSLCQAIATQITTVFDSERNEL
jgi:phosphoglucosamine mutase